MTFSRPKRVRSILRTVNFSGLIALLLWATTAQAAERQFSLMLKAGNPANGVQTFKVSQDDRVSVTISADKKTELHLHGYDVKVTAQPAMPGQLEFIAKISGRFPLTVHRHHSAKQKGLKLTADHGAVAYVEVHPK